MKSKEWRKVSQFSNLVIPWLNLTELTEYCAFECILQDKLIFTQQVVYCQSYLFKMTEFSIKYNVSLPTLLFC